MYSQQKPKFFAYSNHSVRVIQAAICWLYRVLSSSATPTPPPSLTLPAPLNPLTNTGDRSNLCGAPPKFLLRRTQRVEPHKQTLYWTKGVILRNLRALFHPLCDRTLSHPHTQPPVPMAADADERTPLLKIKSGAGAVKRVGRGLWSPANRILFAGFLVSLTLGLTQVPIIYVFRVMACETFYKSHVPYDGPASEMCHRREIDANTATQVSILGMTTSVCGILNLFICGDLIKRWGTRWALISQTGLLGIRVSCQVLAVSQGAQKGIDMMQYTQLIGIFGGPRGYMLVLNTAIAEVVERRKHTGVFGRLQGAVMIGTAIGYLLGGVLGDVFGITSPFIVAIGCFAFATTYGAIFWPAPPEETEQTDGKTTPGASGFLAPIKVLMPSKYRLESGKIVKNYGLVFLALGIFFGVFATGYAPILIQMYATSRFNFGTTENGILMSGNSWIRGIFLMFIFPEIIDSGRRWFASSSHAGALQKTLTQEERSVIPTHPEDMDPAPGLMNASEPTKAPPEEEDEDSTFDLFFLRWSLVVDGIVTSLAAWATEGWHVYAAAFLLPFASGSAPAAKGVITEMCPPHMRQDALSAITLVESAATLTTQGIFGFIFATLSEMGKPNLTFFVNAALAVVAVGILLLAHYPPVNSTRVEDEASEEISESN
ncbi:major facilitator superfamily transporter [Colletotrichum melonis]|uniref:Major facilitator superfamily transporter n=2 Tax=Colletotrichum acutatum species complex TaxID=2707335 RepID=A0AAI9U0I3_9PEZI|nr:major facilitator superfamily transporter [Colletotrichum melonis]